MSAQFSHWLSNNADHKPKKETNMTSQYSAFFLVYFNALLVFFMMYSMVYATTYAVNYGHRRNSKIKITDSFSITFQQSAFKKRTIGTQFMFGLILACVIMIFASYKVGGVFDIAQLVQTIIIAMAATLGSRDGYNKLK